MPGGGTADPTGPVVVGGGCAGLALAVATAELGGPLTVLEARRGDADERTWCYWDVGAALLPDATSAAWTRWEVRTADGRTTAGDPAHPYRMVRARDYRAAARRRIATADGVRILDGVRVGRDAVREAWVDARGPAAPEALRRGRVRLDQRFLGQWIRTRRPVFDPAVATLMDFTVGPDEAGVRFMYVLPVTPTLAMVECTVLARPGRRTGAFRDVIRDYLARRWGLAGTEWTVEGEEAGSIPMTDQPPAAAGPALGLRAGTARPSTGYAFTRIQLAARRAAEALAAGRPVPVARDPLRTRLLDAVFLRFLRDRPDRAPEVFLRMFAALPGALTVRFLTERSSPLDDLRLVLALPKRPFLLAALTTVLERLGAARP